jgi:fructose/tagatose bisphosphate aldolase
MGITERLIAESGIANNKINKALNLISTYKINYNIDNNKWLIDQIVRALTNYEYDPQKYNEWRNNLSYSWDEGVAP